MLRNAALKRGAKLAAQALISAALIALVVRAFDVKGLGARLLAVDPAALAAGLALALAVALPHTGRWLVVIRADGHRLRFTQALRIVLVGYFFNQTLPSSVGGDVMRVYFGYRAGLGLDTAAASVIVDRLMTLVALLLAATAALPWIFQVVSDPLAHFGIALVILGGWAGYALLLVSDRLPQSWLRWRVIRALARVAGLARGLLLTPRAAAAAIGLSLLGFLLAGVIVYLCFRALQVQVPLLYCIVLLMPVMLVTSLPISVAGWGVREGAMVVAFGYVNVPAESAFAMSVLFGLTMLMSGIPGSILWWWSADRKR